MKKELRQYLESVGLRSAATDQDAWKFFGELEGEQRSEAKTIRSGQQRSHNAPSAGEGDDGESQRSASVVDPQAAVIAERERNASIRSLFNGDAPELQQRAEDEGWSQERASNELLRHVRENMNSNGNAGGNGTAIHTTAGIDNDGLQAAMLSRAGIQFDSEMFNHPAARSMLSGTASWMTSGINSEERQRAMEAGDRYGSLSMVDLARHSLQLAGRQIPLSQEEMIRSAFETGSLEPIFTSNINARLLSGYVEHGDSTQEWTNVEQDFVDFKQHDMVGMGRMGQLTKHARKKTADHMDVGAETEPMRIARYSGQWCIDEMDMIDNRLGSGDFGAPEDMGRAAMQLRPNLVYSILLANADLQKDSLGALFNDACNNNFAATLSVEALETAITQMADQRQRDRPLNLMAKYLLVPPKLYFEAKRILRTSTLETDRSQPLQGTANPIMDMLKPIMDSRLGLAGVTDPDTGTKYAGKDDQFFVTAAPGENGARTVSVAYRSGTNRSPVVRPYTFEKGKWGMGWDIKHDIGAKALDRIAMQRFNG